MKRMVKMSVLLVMMLGMFANFGFAMEMKKVLILYVPIAQHEVTLVLKGLEEAGFVEQHNLTIVQVLVSGTSNPAQVRAQVQEIAPDVIISAHDLGHITAALKGLLIPVIVAMGGEGYMNAEGVPTANVTGIYSILPDMVYNSYKFLQKVAPLKPGQQAVFLDIPASPFISRVQVEEALQRLHIPLKAVVDATIYEHWQQAILQYNEDPEVGWILRGIGPSRKQDGSPVNVFSEVFLWEQEHLKKPMVTYWEIAVSRGALCGFGIDTAARGKQIGKLAARVLQGEPINTIKAEYPQNVSIALNRKTATNLGITFSIDVLKLANVIYDDYEGKQVIRK